MSLQRATPLSCLALAPCYATLSPHRLSLSTARHVLSEVDSGLWTLQSRAVSRASCINPRPAVQMQCARNYLSRCSQPIRPEDVQAASRALGVRAWQLKADDDIATALLVLNPPTPLEAIKAVPSLAPVAVPQLTPRRSLDGSAAGAAPAQAAGHDRLAGGGAELRSAVDADVPRFKSEFEAAAGLADGPGTAASSAASNETAAFAPATPCAGSSARLCTSSLDLDEPPALPGADSVAVADADARPALVCTEAQRDVVVSPRLGAKSCSDQDGAGAAHAPARACQHNRQSGRGWLWQGALIALEVAAVAGAAYMLSRAVGYRAGLRRIARFPR